MKVVVALPQLSGDSDAALRAAADAERAGAFGISCFDNLNGLRDPSLPVLEAWTLLAAAARATSTARVVSLVTRAGLRHPQLLLSMTRVVAVASSGRLVVGLGAGDALSRTEEHRFGIQGPNRAARLEEIRRLAASLAHPGDHERPKGGPVPVWIGGASPALQALAAECGAAAWHGWGVDPARFAALAAQASAAGLEAWWGGYFDEQTPRLVGRLEEAGTDGITLQIRSRDDRRLRPLLHEWLGSR